MKHHPIVPWIGGLQISSTEIRYTVGGAGRAGKSGELIITNFPRT